MRFTPLEALLVWGVMWAVPVCHLTGRRHHRPPSDVDLDGTWRRNTTPGGESDG